VPKIIFTAKNAKQKRKEHKNQLQVPPVNKSGLKKHLFYLPNFSKFIKPLKPSVAVFQLYYLSILKVGF
jgi:hypothetical protein